MRFVIFRILIILAFFALGTGLFITQVVHGDYYHKLGDKNRIRLIPLEAPRGRVFDRNGRPVATNRPSYDVVATPEDIEPEGIRRLAAILKEKEEDIIKRLKARREYPFAPAVIAEDVGRETAFIVEERRPELAGVDIRISGLRYYPYKETGSHIVGFIGKLNEKEYDRLREQHDRYGLNSLIGRIGVERIYDDQLRGWRGGRQIEVNSRGRLVRVLSETHPEPGEDLTLALDLEFQDRIMELIREQHASVAILDLDTEELLALASSPAFDPNIFVMPGKGKQRMAFLKDKEAPLLDRGISSAYPPGSVFKLVTALAALESGKITPQTTFYCSGQYQLTSNSRPRKCWFAQGHGELNLYQAIERSCNVYFYNLGRLLSADTIAKYARQLGLGKEMEIELSNISPGLVPDAHWKKEKFRDRWYQGETLSYAIGQSYLLTSPLQILKLVSIIAKSGEAVEPKLLKQEKPETKPDEKRLTIKKENFEIIKKGMLQVVESDFGTGQLARLDFGEMGAKTGTAQAPPKDSHAWMTGFFPFDKPKIAYVVFVEHGGSGGVVGAEIVKGTLEAWKELNVAKIA